MKTKTFQILIIFLAFYCILICQPAKSGDFVEKKVFLKQDCKSNPDYICHLRGDNSPSYE